MLTYSDTSKKVSQYISDFMAGKREVRECLDSLSKSGDLILFGGAIRDIVCGNKPRDYDIVVSTSSENLISILSSYPHKRNRFGGVHLFLNDVKLDIWAIESTWAFQKKLLDSKTENLTKSVFFNLDAIAINLTKNILYGNIFFQALSSRTLDIVLENNPFPDLCILRAFVLKEKYNMSFSQRMKNYILDHCTDVSKTLSNLTSIQQSHYGYQYYNRNQLSKHLSYVYQKFTP